MQLGCVLQLERDYFSPFNQSDHCFLASSLPLPSPLLALRYVTLHYVTLHYVTLRYITLRYVTLRCIVFLVPYSSCNFLLCGRREHLTTYFQFSFLLPNCSYQFNSVIVTLPTLILLKTNDWNGSRN